LHCRWAGFPLNNLLSFQSRAAPETWIIHDLAWPLNRPLCWWCHTLLTCLLSYGACRGPRSLSTVGEHIQEIQHDIIAQVCWNPKRSIFWWLSHLTFVLVK
jgi:hypothetical protein